MTTQEALKYITRHHPHSIYLNETELSTLRGIDKQTQARRRKEAIGIVPTISVYEGPKYLILDYAKWLSGDTNFELSINELKEEINRIFPKTIEFTAKNIAQLLGVSADTINRHRTKGTGIKSSLDEKGKPSYKINDVIEWMIDHRVRTA